MDIRIYGRKSSNREYLNKYLKGVLQVAGIEDRISVVEDVEKYISMGLTSIPSVRIDNEITLSFTNSIPMKRFARKVAKAILKKHKYGTLNKIMIPTDFSSSSKEALYYAKMLCEQNNTVFELVHVFRPHLHEEDFKTFESGYSSEKLDRLSSRYKKLLLDDLKSDFWIDTTQLTGFAGPSLIGHIESSKPTVVIMGTKGENESKKWFGSVSLQVALQASRPVLLVPPGGGMDLPKRILISVGDEAKWDDGFEFLIRMAKRCDAEIHLAYMGNNKVPMLDYDLKKLWSRHYPKDKISTLFLTGNENSSQLLAFAKKHQYGLIVSQRRKDNWLHRMTSENVNKSLAIKTVMPILII